MLESKTMRPLAGESLLAAWERSAPEHDLDRALTMIATALPDADREQLGALPIAERNALLLRLHELTFGPLLSVFGVCATCGAQFEFAVPTAGLAGQSPVGQVAWREKGRHYRLRAVTTDDLLATLSVPETGAAEDLLLARCLEVSPAAGQRRASAATLQRFEQLNAASELSCSVDCPGVPAESSSISTWPGSCGRRSGTPPGDCSARFTGWRRPTAGASGPSPR